MQLYDDRLTFLLPRPIWVNDMDVSCCSSCNAAFGPLKRRHHCRNCGNIFCHECSNRNVPLPQLGYGTKPVRVCSGCFDVAYLVTYAIDEDHGISTQIHGVRGLLELAEKDDEKDLHNMVVYGGVDALIWLCRSSKNVKLHHLSTTILAMLAEKESIRPVIITKWALPPLLYLIRYYTTSESIHQKLTFKKSPPNSIHSAATPSLSSSPSSDTTTNSSESLQSIILEIVINCTHIIYQLSRANILSQKEVVSDGVFETLLTLASFNLQCLQWERIITEGSPTILSVASDDEQQSVDRVNIIQSLAAKAISAICSLVPFQVSIIELIKDTDKLSNLLRSENQDVKKYAAKTIAYLSLRNDKYKPTLLCGEGAHALISILVTLPQNIDEDYRLTDLTYYLSQHQIESDTVNKKGVDQRHQSLNSAAVSHACCALANFATNNESQVNLMSQPHLLKYICNVPFIFSSHIEIHRHVARCLANLALYAENNEAMLNDNIKSEGKDCYNVIPTLLFMGKSSEIQRHIVRAIDNLCSNLPADSTKDSVHLFGETRTYIEAILNDDSSKDVDVYKRARSIMYVLRTEDLNEQDNVDTTPSNEDASKGMEDS